jgi:hypothetical protein
VLVGLTNYADFGKMDTFLTLNFYVDAVVRFGDRVVANVKDKGRSFLHSERR